MFGENSDNSNVFTCKKCGTCKSKPKGLNFREFRNFVMYKYFVRLYVKLTSRKKGTIRSKITNYILYDFRAQLGLIHKL